MVAALFFFSRKKVCLLFFFSDFLSTCDSGNIFPPLFVLIFSYKKNRREDEWRGGEGSRGEVDPGDLSAGEQRPVGIRGTVSCWVAGVISTPVWPGAWAKPCVSQAIVDKSGWGNLMCRMECFLNVLDLFHMTKWGEKKLFEKGGPPRDWVIEWWHSKGTAQIYCQFSHLATAHFFPLVQH